MAFGPRKVFESLEAIASEDPSESGRDFHNHRENRKVSEFESKLESKSTRSMKNRERTRKNVCRGGGRAPLWVHVWDDLYACSFPFGKVNKQTPKNCGKMQENKSLILKHL